MNQELNIGDLVRVKDLSGFQTIPCGNNRQDSPGAKKYRSWAFIQAPTLHGIITSLVDSGHYGVTINGTEEERVFKHYCIVEKVK